MEIVGRNQLRLVFALLLVGCIALAVHSLILHQSPAAPQPPRLRFTVPPGKDSPVEIQTLPDALCTLRSPQDPKDPAHGMTFFSNSNGVARFFAHPEKQLDEVVSVVIDCAAGGKTLTHTLDFRANSIPTREMPAPTITKRRSPSANSIRPALSAAEASQLSSEELRKRHYPFRPDPKSSPAAYRAWLKVVTIPVTMVPPKLVPIVNRKPTFNPGFPMIPAPTFNMSNTPNWSGVQVSKTTGPFVLVLGIWKVPTVGIESALFAHDESATWVGIDGNVDKQDFFQCGTDQGGYKVFGIPFTHYWAWTVFYPVAENPDELSNIPVEPGDTIFAETWVTDASGGVANINGGFIFFDIESLGGPSGDVATTVSIPIGSTVIHGSTAEWIEERVANGPNSSDLYNLANFTPVTISSAFALMSIPGNKLDLMDCCSGGGTIFTITDSKGTELSTVSIVDSTALTFTFHSSR